MSTAVKLGVSKTKVAVTSAAVVTWVAMQVNELGCGIGKVVATAGQTMVSSGESSELAANDSAFSARVVEKLIEKVSGCPAAVKVVGLTVTLVITCASADAERPISAHRPRTSSNSARGAKRTAAAQRSAARSASRASAEGRSVCAARAAPDPAPLLKCLARSAPPDAASSPTRSRRVRPRRGLAGPQKDKACDRVARGVRLPFTIA